MNENSKTEQRPFIAIPLGDPAGIGPEIVLKSVLDKEICKETRCVVIGDYSIMKMMLNLLHLEGEFVLIKDPAEGDYQPGIINLIDLDNLDINNYRIGQINGACGHAAYEYIAKAIELAMAHKVRAVATPPINKEALKLGGIPYIGHTEIFGALTNSKDPLTMFEVHGLRVFFLSRHVSLVEACKLVTKERIEDYVKRCFKALEQLGVTEGTMAVAGLNPHSGEHGLFGTEEEKEIIPAVKTLQSEGYTVVGPIGADSVFHLALIGRYNSVLSLYHDQGHIATKTLDFEKTISFTLGLPILRTSVDHGTAMDIAGKGIASAISMIEAIKLAKKYCINF